MNRSIARLTPVADVFSQQFRPTRLGILSLILLLISGFIGSQIKRPVASSVIASAGAPTVHTLATMSETVTVHAAGRGTPYINFSDGHDVLTGYSAASSGSAALQSPQSPLAMASADFDEDGVPDLVSGYSAGIVILHRGNIDSIYPNAPEAQQRKASGSFSDSPFLSPAGVFDLPQTADFVGAGDFDADGHWDVVTASRSDDALYLLSGDGHGGFSEARRIELPGRVTALATGEINRADGLTDIVVGVAAADGPKALVFEGPEGALRAGPETFTLAAEATSFAFGRLDDDYTMDLAIADGSELTVVFGRDRKLSLDEIRQKEVLKAKVSRRSFAFAIRSVAMGDFKGDHKIGLSMLTDQGSVHLLTPAPPKKAKKKKKAVSIESWKDEMLATGNWHGATTMFRARVSSAPCDDLVILDSASRKLHMFASNAAGGAQQAASFQQVSFDVDSEPMAVIAMRLNSDALSDLVILRNGQAGPTALVTQVAMVFTVNSNADSGAGSLRDAITQANANAGLDTISFGIGVGPQTITPLSMLPTVTDPIVMDGTTQPGFAGTPIIEINGPSSGGGLSFAGDNVIRGLVINNSGLDGILLIAPGNNIVEGNYVGTDITGTVDRGNGRLGVFVSDSPNNRIGGTAAGARNVISGNGSLGVQIQNANSFGNVMQGNFIGTDVTGSAPLANDAGGVFIFGTPNVFVGGTVAGARNVISANGGEGVSVANASAAGTVVQGNLIGTNASGTAALGNSGNGVSISSPSNTVGGTNSAARNIISGNSGVATSGTGHGVVIGGSTGTQNIVEGNYIGTDINGLIALANGRGGVFIFNGATGNSVGGVGATPGGPPGNLISGNTLAGVNIQGVFGSFVPANANQVLGNLIGTNAAGTAPLANAAGGLRLSSANNTIGGTVAGAGNVISGNNSDGLFITGGGNQLQGNFIGTNSSGNAALGNASNGIFISNAAGNVIGPGNVVSGNGGSGIALPSAGATGNQIQGNLIGTNAEGTAALGNASNGIFLSNAPNNTIGGAAAGSRNIISGNNQVGIFIFGSSATGNQVKGNFIGTDVTGAVGLGNTQHGVNIFNGAANNRIGGATVAERNVISGNGFHGVSINASSGNTVQGNFIGTDATGTAPLGNRLNGVAIGATAAITPTNNLIGGTGSGEGNVIAFNAVNGLLLFPPAGGSNPILSNSIFSNGELGIDLGDNGVTPNDSCDTDAGGNNLQNTPVLSAVFPSGNRMAIQGTLHSTANGTFTIQFFSNSGCDLSGFGEGEHFLGSTQVTTDVTCNASFSFLADGVQPGQSITATATDAVGNTSEFSNCIAIGAGALNVAITKSVSPPAVRPGNNVTYTITVTNKGPAIATNIALTDNLAPQLTFVSCAASNGSCGGSSNNRSLNLPLLALNATVTLTIEAKVNSSVANGTVINNTATVTASLGETTATATATAGVTVLTQAPAINCPANVLAASAQGQTTTIVNYPAPTVAGNPPNVAVTCVPPSGSTFPLGTTTVNCTATDAANNSSSCSFNVTVNQGNPSLDKTDVDFGNPIALPNQNPPTDTFTITNASATSVDLTLASIRRTGSDVGNRITNPDDSGFFTVFAINPGGADTQLGLGSTIPIPAGQRNFRVMFNPSIPPVASGTSNLSASQVLPDVITSSITFNVSGGGSLTVNLTGRVATGLRLIDPANPTRSPVVTFSRSGNQFNLIYSVFDSNLNVSRASYQFLDNGGQPSGQPVDVNLGQALQAINLVRGQSFTVDQPFSGASSHPEIAGVRVTVFDGETSVSAAATLGSSAASNLPAGDGQRMRVVLPRLRIQRFTP